ncbi:MAG: DMT family transporter [Rickettsiales bacterium]
MNKAPHIDSPARGIVLMLSGLLLLTLNDATAKWLTTGYPVPQVISLRGIFILIPLAIVIYWRGGFAAFRLMPLADAIAFTFSGPLIVAALAPFLLGERVGWRRWSAILVGFAGVVVMARPTPDAFQWAALIALCAAFSGAMRDMVTRRISAEESSDLILFTSTLAVTSAGALAAVSFPWRMPDAVDFGLFALLGLLNGGAHYLMIEAHRWGEASLIAPFRYTALVWAFILGYLVWGDLPDVWLLSGSVLVVGSGLYILQRETRAKRP